MLDYGPEGFNRGMSSSRATSSSDSGSFLGGLGNTLGNFGRDVGGFVQDISPLTSLFGIGGNNATSPPGS